MRGDATLPLIAAAMRCCRLLPRRLFLLIFYFFIDYDACRLVADEMPIRCYAC